MAEVLRIEHEERYSDLANDAHLEYPEKQGRALQWLSENRQLNDNQLFAHVTAEVQLALEATVRTESVSFPEGSNALGKHHGRRPAKKIDFGHVEVWTHLLAMPCQRTMYYRGGCMYIICSLHP
jgi:hypothetical protein